MRDELENKLAQEFPFMRRSSEALKKHNIEDLYGAFGCEFDDGWYELMREMCAEIAEAYANRRIEVDFVPMQVKEKYGALRVYFSASREMGGTVQEIIDRYEEKSMAVCEYCGQPGALRSDLSWQRTLCDAHYQDAAKVTTEENFKHALEDLRKMGEYIDAGYTPTEAANKIKADYDMGGI